MAAMGLGDGKHSLGDMSVFIEGDRPTILGTDTLAGSVVSMILASGDSSNSPIVPLEKLFFVLHCIQPWF
jgi:N-acetylglucosamine-6-phosphate deacetylase